MDDHQLQMMRNYLNNAQLQLYTAQFAKVHATWNYHSRLPEVNRMYYFIDGAGSIRIENREYAPKPGQLFLLPAYVDQAYTTQKDDPFHKYYCHFTLTVGGIHLFQLFQVPHFVNVGDDAWLKERFLKLIALSDDNGLTTSILIKSILYEILALFLDKAQAQGKPQDWGIGTTTPAMTKIHMTLRYIDEHLSEQMKIEELAEHAHFHPNYFIQLFKSIMGVSPIAYITRKRMEKSQHLLLSSDLSVTEIAEQVGMELSYFSHTFRKLVGPSPSEYRRIFS